MTREFNFDRITADDEDLYLNIVGDFRAPDLVIAPDGHPYLYRWHVTPPKMPANVYFHIQVSDDPERPLHDHPWDNMSVILSGDGYRELLSLSEGEPFPDTINTFIRRPGDVIFRRAKQAHRLLLMPGERGYTMTLFSTGPKINDWGFWYPEGKRPYQDVTVMKDGMSVHIKPGSM